MDGVLKPKENTSEVAASNTQSLAKMPSFKEHMAEIEEGNEKGTVGVEALISKPAEDKLDPFWENHPDLLKEARELGAPLTVKEFREQGYGFEKDNNGGHHVLAPTPAYTEWSESNSKDASAFRGYARENIDDRNQRIWEEQRAEEKKKELMQKMAEREVIRNDWASNEHIDEKYRELFGDRELDAKEKGILHRNVKNLVENTFYRRDRRRRDSYNYTASIYRHAFYDALKNSDSEVSEETLVRGANDYFESPNAGLSVEDAFSNGSVSAEAKKRRSIAVPIAIDILRERQMEILGDDIRKRVSQLSLENRAEIEQKTVMSSIAGGDFMPDAIITNPEFAKNVLTKNGMSIEQDGITIEAIEGYKKIKNDERKEQFTKFFDLENRINSMYEEGKIGVANGVVVSRDAPRGKWDWWEYKIPEEISGKMLETYSNRLDKLMDGVQEVLDSDCKKTASREIDSLQDYLRWCACVNHDFDFDKYLGEKTVGVKFEKTRIFVESALARCKSRDSWWKVLETIPHKKEITIDNQKTVTDELKRLLADGVDGNPNNPDYLTRIFESRSYKKVQERLGIDFKDPKIAEIAFDGLINTLGTKNGPESEQANWYYDAIFANDPNGFLGKLEAFKERSHDSGMRGRINRFTKNNPQIFEDKIRYDLEKRFQKEINNEKRAIRTSVLREAKRGDISKILDDYKKEVIDRVRAKGAEEITTFAGKPSTRGEQEETGREDRKETPFDYGIEKGSALLRYGDFVEATFPDSDIHWFTDTFPTRGKDKEIFDNQNSYIGFSFEYNGKLCAIAESLNKEGAMYLWRGEIGEDLNDDFRQMFDIARVDASRSTDPRIAHVDHLRPEHFDESLDEAYQKAFMFFNSGDKQEILYKKFGGREKWNEHRDEVLSAWPLSTEQDYVNYPEDLERYHEWQQRQAEIQSRLKMAVEQGGQDAVKRELEKIAEEDYLAMYEGRR